MASGAAATRLKCPMLRHQERLQANSRPASHASATRPVTCLQGETWNTP